MQHANNETVIGFYVRNKLQHFATKLPVCNIYMVFATESVVCCKPISSYSIDNHPIKNLFLVLRPLHLKRCLVRESFLFPSFSAIIMVQKSISDASCHRRIAHSALTLGTHSDTRLYPCSTGFIIMDGDKGYLSLNAATHRIPFYIICAHTHAKKKCYLLLYASPRHLCSPSGYKLPETLLISL